MSYLEALLLGFVEGLTEFLPISSTGHLILAEHWLGMAESEAIKAFSIIIQSGAILAVIVYYFKYLSNIARRSLKLDPYALHETKSVAIAFFPAAVIGLLLGKKIKEHLFGVAPVAWALILGGVLIIILERFFARPKILTMQSKDGSFQLTARQSLGIGIFQCAALWPGVSRSMATILGGRFMGVSNAKAAEFSFILAIPTLLGATALNLLQAFESIKGQEGNFAGVLLVGIFVSFTVALAVIHFFISFLKSYSLEVFGWYRLVLGGLILWFF